MADADEVIAAMQNMQGSGRGNRNNSRRNMMDDDTSSYRGYSETPSRTQEYNSSPYNGYNQHHVQDSFNDSSSYDHGRSPISSPGGMIGGNNNFDSFSSSNNFPPSPPQRDEDNQSMSNRSTIGANNLTNKSFTAPPQNQFNRNVEINESMILDGRTRRFSVRIPWASYCMLRPYVCASAASTETGRIVGRAQQLNSDILVPTVLHTQDKSQLPRSMTPKIRLLDGRTLRSFHRFSEIRQFTVDMASALGTPLVEIGWFPWRNLHHTLVNVETRRAKLEAYLGMLFTHNQAMQTHPLTLSFFTRSGAADIQVGVIVPPPIKTLSSYNAMQNASENSVTARSVVSTSKRLITVVVDIDLSAGLSEPLKCAKEAAELLTTKLKTATHGDDMSELRIISLEGVAPPAVVTGVEFALNRELGTRATPFFNDEPNLQLLRAFHHADQSGEGVLKADVLKLLLKNLGVHVPPEVISDLLLQSYVHGETSALWHGTNTGGGNDGDTNGDGSGGGARGGNRLVDYHTFLSLVVARTQSRLIRRQGEEELLAGASMHAHINKDDRMIAFYNNGNNQDQAEVVAAVEVSSRAPFDWRNAGLNRFSLVLMASAHAGGAVAAAGGQGGGYGGGITPMQEGSPSFLDFKNKVERGFEAKVHKMKWPKTAAMVHKAVGIDPEALNGADTSNKGPSHISNSTNVNPFGDVNKPFLVVRTRLMRVTDTWTKLVWFKQGMKGAVMKVGRAFNSGMVRPSDQPGAGVFDLLQVTQVRVVENPKSSLGRWFLFKTDKSNGNSVDKFFALIGLTESLYLEASSTSERDWMVAGFRQLLFGAEGRARARGFAHGRALNSSSTMVDPRHLADMEGATGAAAASAIDQAMAAADASAHSFANGGGNNLQNSSFGNMNGSQNALRLFEKFDTNGSGTLDLNEARNALRWANFVEDGPRGMEVLNKLFRRFDLDRNGTLDLREFGRLVLACEQGEE